MIFKQIPVGNMENFSYLIACEKTKKAAIFDPGWDGEKILETAKHLDVEIEKIFLTHVHYDHSGQAEFLQAKTGAKAYAPNTIPDWKQDHEKFIIPKKYIALSDKEKINIGEIEIEALSSPGHQDDHMMFIVDKKYLIAGDTLFIGSIGGLHFKGSVREKMPSTLKKINTLPENLIVCPGHDYGETPMRTLQEEKEKNPFLKNPLLALSK